MKKLLIFVSSFFLFLNLFSTDLYIRIDFNDKENLLAAVQKAGKEKGINVIDYDSLDLLNTSKQVRLIGGESLSEEEKIAQLEAEIQKLQQDREKGIYPEANMFERAEFVKKGAPARTDQEKKDYVVDNRIKAKQEEIKKLEDTIEKLSKKINPNDCYPKLELEAGFSRGDFGITSNLSFNSKDTPIEYKDFYTAEFGKNNINNYLEKYIEAFFPILQTNKEVAVPEIVDKRYLKIDKSTKRSLMAEVAARDDYSFVLRRGNIVEEYSPNWDLKYTYTKQLPKVEGTDEWEPRCYDGKNIVFGNLSYPAIFSLTKNHKLQRLEQVKIPSNSVMMRYKFLSNGEPYVVVTGDNVQIHLLKDNKVITTRDLGFAYVNFIFAGPDETFYIGRNGGAVNVYSKDGELKKIIQIRGKSSYIYRSVLAVLEDGSFLAYDYGDIVRFNNDGQKIWAFTCSDGFQNNDCISARNGMYYFYNNSEKSITRLADSQAKLPQTLTLIKEANSKLANASINETADIYLKIADAYYKDKSYKSALNYYELYLQISPANAKVAEKKLNCEIILNKQTAKSKTKKAIKLYEEYGEETAKSDYQQAMKLLEKLKKQVPWDEEVQTLFAELKSTFSPEDSAGKAQKLSLKVSEVDLTALFPALISVYSKNPSGFMQIKNTSKNSLKNITLTSSIKKYMDFPSKSEPVTELKAGEAAYIPISTILNQNVLKINEATPVQIQFTLNWEENGKAYSTNITRTVTIYKKSALTWADTAMASCFVLPNEPEVSDFIFNAMNCKMETLLSTNLTKAIQIADALGSIPLNYVADPVTPATQVIDNEFAIDTIRFPSETLRLKGGDCDDMTTLFCSLLEGTNVETAFITTEGHIFAAFNTGIDYNQIWKKLDKNHMTFNIQNKVWMPIECTSLGQGFIQAWETASKLIGKEKFEVTTLASAWETYSSVPTETEKSSKSDTSASIKLKADVLNKMNQKNRSETIKILSKAMDKTDASKISGDELNQLAKMYHFIGDDDKAITLLLSLTTREPENYKGYKNLAMLYELKGDTQNAGIYKQKANSYASNKSGTKASAKRAGEAKNDEWAD